MDGLWCRQAEQASRSLVMSAQYPAVIPIYRDFYARVRGTWDAIDSLEMVMESKGRRGPKAREDIWIDLAAHPLSLVLGFCQGRNRLGNGFVCDRRAGESRAF